MLEADNEVSCLRYDIVRLEAQVCRYKGKAQASTSTVTSISSSVKRKAEVTPPPSTRLARSPPLPHAEPVGSASNPMLVDITGPALSIPKIPKWYDTTNWHTDPDNDTNVEAHRPHASVIKMAFKAYRPKGHKGCIICVGGIYAVPLQSMLAGIYHGPLQHVG